MTAIPDDLHQSPLDRSLQRKLLLLMRDVYPQPIYKIWALVPDTGDDATVANLVYLEEHGLCDAGIRVNQDGSYGFTGAKITARGLDFIEDDGGLSAILDVVTIKVHADSLRALLVNKIDAAPIAPEEKSRLRTALGKLPGTALNAAASDLVKAGIDHIPNVVEWLHTLGI